MKFNYPIVDDSDQIVGYRGKEQAYKERAMLRSVQIFVYNTKGELYIQKRGGNKLRYQGYFCASVAGHVEPGESYREAATRELREELGLKLKKVDDLKFIVKEKIPVGEDNYAMTSLFTIITDESITLQKKEIETGKFYTLKNVQRLISESFPFTPGFLYLFNKQYSTFQKNYLGCKDKETSDWD